MSKLLLREFFALCPDGSCLNILTEDEKRKASDGTTYLVGIIQAAESLNGNKRVYPRRVLEREVKNYKKLCKERRSLGELDHPDDSVVNLKNVSHLVTDVWWDGDNVMGKVEVLDTPSGKILQSLIGSGVSCGISSRGLGSVREERGRTMVEDDYQLICFDIVQEPSTPGAFMSPPSLRENKQPNIITKADKIYRALNDVLHGEKK